MFNFDDFTFDRQHIWHPYTSMRNPLPCYAVVAAKGCCLELADGRKLVDGMSSWWSAIHGYNHQRLNHALKKQIDYMSHVMFGGITHPAAVSLCRKLVGITPKELQCVFLSDSGSVAVEVSMKMAMQYWLGRGEKRPKFLTIKGGYHGDTLSAMSVCDPDNSIHSLWRGFVPKNYFTVAPNCSFYSSWNESELDDFYKKVEQHHNNLAAIILEPIVQGVGGMRFYHPCYLQRVREVCSHYGLLLIADEIATGFGRTGKLFACEHADIVPDIMCLGKALTGGTMTLAATLTTNDIAHTISSATNCLMHGPTFMGNPLACAVACESLSLIIEGKWFNQVANIEKHLKKMYVSLNNHSRVADVRVLGAIGVIETHQYINIAAIQEFFVKQDVWIRPFNKVIYLIPPYIITYKQLDKLINAISEALDHSDFFYY
ncbi:adenosylmethionine--8-amino-7-oxononanoate transaminase [Candidatus Ishikawella capsulata]|uniref:Adenosylmethionine-8-amino-7-oxononanoate aminotransferase n=1 Tax=Candidatus Ishikawaella capsulata Mpkobe TaxID=476281 RepID=C5WDC4_9ENTR|nr:adenosylmethionine--8-amino-7-oxononanoate transaminase [Candidatus Ishikawaella capsulata]BAH83330.1 adenosylmethionine--8-amino-7-oxononanoate transaminase [Candidatus Ishikawaella capsulata Mpkobe]